MTTSPIMLGFSFTVGPHQSKSPLVILAEALLGKGHHQRICDQDGSIACLLGRRGKLQPAEPMPSWNLADRVEEGIDALDVTVVGNAAPEFREALRKPGRISRGHRLARVSLDGERFERPVMESAGGGGPLCAVRPTA